VLRYLIRRILFSILVLFVVSLFTFVVFVKLPTVDPAIRIAGKHPSPELLETIRGKLGLDRPAVYQYAKFAKGLIPWPGLFLNEDVYYSWFTRVAVRDEILTRLPVTMVLAAGAAVMWLLIGIPVGIISARRPGSVADRSGTMFALIGVSMPDFFLALVLLYLFHFQWGIAPSSGIPPGESLWEAVLMGRFWLPWFALAFTFAAFYSRIVRGSLMETMDEDYIRTARAKGLSERRVVYRHGLRSTLTPVVTMFGLDMALLLGGAVILENVFQLPGIGQYAIQSLGTNDFPPIMGVTIVGALFIVLANLIVDMVYAALDPRVRYS
jgi:peptide/nickel transport system permease protein